MVPDFIAPDMSDLQLTEFFAALEKASQAAADSLSDFFKFFDQQYSEARKLRAPTTPHFNLLAVFGLQFSELRHSDVLAWFLDPQAAHEQGGIFADRLLLLCGDDGGASDTHVVIRERHGRVDLAMYARGEFAVFIENKVRHFERDQQVSDMIASMARVAVDCGIPLKRRYAVFLTDTGEAAISGPKTDSADFRLGNLTALSRTQIFEGFRTALAEQGGFSPLLMNFLESYLLSIQQIRSQLFRP